MIILWLLLELSIHYSMPFLPFPDIRFPYQNSKFNLKQIRFYQIFGIISIHRQTSTGHMKDMKKQMCIFCPLSLKINRLFIIQVDILKINKKGWTETKPSSLDRILKTEGVIIVLLTTYGMIRMMHHTEWMLHNIRIKQMSHF